MQIVPLAVCGKHMRNFAQQRTKLKLKKIHVYIFQSANNQLLFNLLDDQQWSLK